MPALDCLHERHPGLTEEVCRYYSQAAFVCLSRHHTPPTAFNVLTNSDMSVLQIEWQLPDERTHGAHANSDDATRDGADEVCLAAVEAERDMVAVRRAEVKSGADYFVATPANGTKELDLENALRLEVSGLDMGDASDIGQRMRDKINQVRRGNGDLPALAAVVGFRAKEIRIQTVT